MTKHISLAALAAFATPAFAQSFVTTTISGTPGFGSVIDSGPGALASSTIDANMADLEAAAASMGCSAEAWAGTWVRGRSPRLQGETETGGTVSGPNITNGTVDGVPFSASLATGGGLAGSTSDGNDLLGFFHRINTNRSIWYGVEVVCDGGPTPTSFPASAPVDGAPLVLDFTGYNVIAASSATETTAQLAGGGQVAIQPGDVIAICPGSAPVSFIDFDPWTGHVFDVLVSDIIIVGQDIGIGTAVFGDNVTVVQDGGTSRLIDLVDFIPVANYHTTAATTFEQPSGGGTEIVADTVHPSIDFGNAFDGCP